MTGAVVPPAKYPEPSLAELDWEAISEIATPTRAIKSTRRFIGSLLGSYCSDDRLAAWAARG